jgi:hypothetical protein
MWRTVVEVVALVKWTGDSALRACWPRLTPGESDPLTEVSTTAGEEQ